MSSSRSCSTNVTDPNVDSAHSQLQSNKAEVVKKEELLNPDKLNKKSSLEPVETNLNIYKPNSSFKDCLQLLDRNKQLFHLKTLFKECYDINNGNRIKTKRMVDKITSKVLVKIDCSRLQNMFTKKENDDSNNPIYEVNKNISIVDCKKSQSNNTKMVKDKIKNPNVHQSNYINDNIEQSESGINDINSVNLLSNQSEESNEVVSVSSTDVLKELNKNDSLETNPCSEFVNKLAKSLKDILNSSRHDIEPNNTDIEVIEIKSNITGHENVDIINSVNHEPKITLQKKNNRSQNETITVNFDLLDYLLNFNKSRTFDKHIYQQTESKTKKNGSTRINNYTNESANIQDTNIELSFEYIMNGEHQIFDTMYNLCVEHHMIFNSYAISKIIDILKNDNLFENKKLWSVTITNRIHYLLKVLLASLDDIEKGKYIVFMGCLNYLFRKVIDCTTLSKIEVGLKYIKFIEIIKKMMILLDKKFWNKWLPTGWNNNLFYIGCIIVDKVMYGISKSRLLIDLVDWSKVPNINALFDLILHYYMHKKTLSADYILKKSSKSNTTTVSAPTIIPRPNMNNSNDGKTVITTSTSNTLSMPSNISENSGMSTITSDMPVISKSITKTSMPLIVSATKINESVNGMSTITSDMPVISKSKTKTLSMPLIVPATKINESVNGISTITSDMPVISKSKTKTLSMPLIVPATKINESVYGISTITSSVPVNTSDMSKISVPNNETFLRPQNNMACGKKKRKTNISKETSSNISNNGILSMNINSLPIKKRKIFDIDSIFSSIPNTTKFPNFPVSHSNENYADNTTSNAITLTMPNYTRNYTTRNVINNNDTLPKPKRKYTRRNIISNDDTLPKPKRKYTKRNIIK